MIKLLSQLNFLLFENSGKKKLFFILVVIISENFIPIRTSPVSGHNGLMTGLVFISEVKIRSIGIFTSH